MSFHSLNDRPMGLLGQIHHIDSTTTPWTSCPGVHSAVWGCRNLHCPNRSMSPDRCTSLQLQHCACTDLCTSPTASPRHFRRGYHHQLGLTPEVGVLPTGLVECSIHFSAMHFNFPTIISACANSKFLDVLCWICFAPTALWALRTPTGFTDLSDPLDIQRIPHGTLPIPSFDKPTPCTCKLLSARPSKNI